MHRATVAVTFLPENRVVSARVGDTLLDAALENGIAIAHECGGNCSCTTCHVYVLAGLENLTPIEEPESYRLEFAEDRDDNSRLACQALLLGGPVSLRLP